MSIIVLLFDYQGNLYHYGGKYGNFICDILVNIQKTDITKIITDIVMINGALNIQLKCQLLKYQYPKLTVMSVIEHTVSFFSMVLLKLKYLAKTLYNTKKYKTSLVLEYITIPIPFSSLNTMNFTIVKMVFAVIMIL